MPFLLKVFWKLLRCCFNEEKCRYSFVWFAFTNIMGLSLIYLCNSVIYATYHLKCWFWTDDVFFSLMFYLLLVFNNMLWLVLLSWFPSTANMPIASHSVVSSIPYHHCNGFAFSAVGRCITSWCTTASAFVSHTGTWKFYFQFSRICFWSIVYSCWMFTYLFIWSTFFVIQNMWFFPQTLLFF